MGGSNLQTCICEVEGGFSRRSRLFSGMATIRTYALYGISAMITFGRLA